MMLCIMKDLKKLGYRGVEMNIEILLTELAKLLETDRESVTLDYPLAGFGNWDSLAIVSMIATIDAIFNVSVKGNEIEQCKTVKDIFILIEHKKNKKM